MSQAAKSPTPRRKRTRMAPGHRHGRLVAINVVTSGLHSKWRFQCDCGREHITKASSVRCGDTQSCGCLKTELAKVLGHRSATHGMRRSKEYKIWDTMHQRCTNPNNEQFFRYGERGIIVCERWRRFENFYADMGPRPSSKHSIDRIDGAGNYEPTNCRWATWKEQARNRRSNRMIIIRGRYVTIAEAAEITGIRSGKIINRLSLGWSAEQALTK